MSDINIHNPERSYISHLASRTVEEIGGEVIQSVAFVLEKINE